MCILVSLILLLNTFAWAQPITNNERLSCKLKNPCRVQSNKNIKPIHVHFSEKLQDEKKTILAVNFIYRQIKQVDSVKVMESVDVEDPYQFQYVNLDGDGYKDLALKVSTGTIINHFHYWRYSRKTGKYISLGKHEEVYFNPTTKKLESVRRRSNAETYNFELRDKEIRSIVE